MTDRLYQLAFAHSPTRGSKKQQSSRAGQRRGNGYTTRRFVAVSVSARSAARVSLLGVPLSAYLHSSGERKQGFWVPLPAVSRRALLWFRSEDTVRFGEVLPDVPVAA